jgi:hypothetical protein
VVHNYKLVLGRLMQEDHEFEASLGYVARSSLKNKPPNKQNKTKKNQTKIHSKAKQNKTEFLTIPKI